MKMCKSLRAALLTLLVALGVCLSVTPATAIARTPDGDYEGVDLSHWDSGLDLTRFADNCNLDFAIIKVGGNERVIGGRYRDSEFKSFYHQACNADLHIGAYYYADTTNAFDAVLDADHCADLLDSYGVRLDMPVYYDIEDSYQQDVTSRRELTDICIAFCDRMQERGYRAGIYTSGSWWLNEVYGEELESYAQWVAWWGIDDYPPMPFYYGMWQVGGIGWNHNTDWNPDAGGFHDYDLCRIEYWEDAPTPIPPKPEPEPEPTPEGKLDVDGYGGTLTVAALQEALGTPVDSWITGQWEGNEEYSWAIWAQEFDEGGSLCVTELQNLIGARTDGYWGRETTTKLQEWLIEHGYDVGECGVDGYAGHDTVKALQRALNDDAIEPAPWPEPGDQGTAEAVIDAAYSQLGYAPMEQDPLPGSKFGRWLAELWGEDWLAGPSNEIWWCELYVSWCLDQGGVWMDGSPTYNTNLAYNNGGWQYEVNKYDVQYADIVQFDWNWDGITDHVGFSVDSYDGYGFPTIEGNVDNNRVAEKYRTMDYVAHVLRPDYA